ncbi:MAG: aldo/keto reductase [Clostridia bacterium]|nr:aldo/keto reductase [Clostridia bacterium]
MYVGKKKGVDISKFTLGTAQLGYDYGVANKIGRLSKEQSFDVLKTAVDHGVISLDTAPSYGNSEQILGEFFSNKCSAIKDATVVTKISHVEGDGNIGYSDIENQVAQSVDSSLNRLKMESIPVCLMHNADYVKAFDGAITESMQKLKAEGKIKNIGVSVYTPEDVELVLKMGVFDAIQIPINIFDHRLIKTGLLNELDKSGMIVFCRSVFLQGLFAMNPDEVPPYLEIAKKPLKRLGELAQKAGCTPIDLALIYIRDLKEIDSLVIGCETPEQVENNAKLLNSPPLEKDLKDEISDAFKDSPLELINPAMWANKSGGR